MAYTTLISCEDLHSNLDHPDWVIVDCRFWLDDTEKGRRDYQDSHIPGAVYAHMDEDLSGSVVPGVTGRHPIPPVDQFATQLGVQANRGSPYHIGRISHTIHLYRHQISERKVDQQYAKSYGYEQ